MIVEGDLVRHRDMRVTGIVVLVEAIMGGDDPLHHIQWTDGTRGVHFIEEIYLISRHTLQSQ